MLMGIIYIIMLIDMTTFDAATSPENICSSEESLKRRLSIRRKIVNQRIKETQDYIYSRSGAFIESKSMQLQH